MRCFLAVNLPDHIKDYVRGLSVNFSGKIKFVEKDNLHITLYFFGEVENTNEIIKKLKTIKFSPFKVKLSNIDFFPNKKRPRVIIVKVNDNGKMNELNNRIIEKLNIHNEKPFRSHVTIGRIKNLESFKIPEIEKMEFPVKSFSLMKSSLATEGPVYEEIERFSHNYSKNS